MQQLTDVLHFANGTTSRCRDHLKVKHRDAVDQHMTMNDLKNQTIRLDEYQSQAAFQ